MCLYACIKMSAEARRGHELSWSWKDRQLGATQHGCWKLNSVRAACISLMTSLSSPCLHRNHQKDSCFHLHNTPR